jgi:3-methyladenine DNA glycosylase AlkC
MAEAFSLKDHLFNGDTVAYLADLFQAADPAFPRHRFVTEAVAAFPTLELKARIAHLADLLGGMLPGDFAAAADLIEAALPPPLDPARVDDDFGHFIFAPLGDYVVARGLAGHFDRSMQVIEALTQRFSMEFAIRPFLNRWPDRTLEVLAGWTGHSHYHVRRLVSEGTRPRLPWSGRVAIRSDQSLPLLDRLYGDATRFVTRSVANHMNDIAKTDPALAVSTVARWQAERCQREGEMDWIARHALRTLVKDGDGAALGLLGYARDAAIDVTRLALAETTVPIGGLLEFTLVLKAEADCRAIVDYRLDFARPNGRRGQKVFKLKSTDLQAGVPLTLTKRHALKGDATTFTLHPGLHRLAVQVNGVITAEAEFDLTRA